MLSSFDTDPVNNAEIDGLISVGPPVAAIGNDFAPLTVDPTFTPSLISTQALHLVSKAQKSVELDGPGRIIFAGPKDDLQAVYVGSGPLPKVTGTNGLTRLNLDRPTPYEFRKGESLFIYYVTVPALSDCSFGELFGNGTRSILTLLADSKKSKPIPSFSNTERVKKPTAPAPARARPIVKSAPARNVYVRVPTPKKKISVARTKPVVHRPLLALLTKSKVRCAKSSLPPSRPKPLFSGKNIAKLREAIQANRAKRGRRPLLSLCKSSSSKSKSCGSRSRQKPVRRSSYCSRSSSRPIFFRKRRSRS